MKKLLLMIIIILTIVCGVLCISYYVLHPIPKEEPKEENNKTEQKEEEKNTVPEYVDNNPIIVGLYKNYHNGSKRKLITNYDTPWKYHKDISSFEVFYTNEEYISGSNQIKTFDLYKNNYENIDDYRIGYIVEFSINDWHINKTILRPKDTEEFYKYLEIYLYDDYHRDGSWYSHTTDEEFNDDTLLTSIKLTAGVNVDAIESDIKVSAFTYLKDDIDANGNYKGKSKYTITVTNINKEE